METFVRIPPLVHSWVSKRPVLRTSDDGAPRPAAGGAVTLGAFATDGPAVGVSGKIGVAVTPPGFIDSNRFLALWGIASAVANRGAVGALGTAKGF